MKGKNSRENSTVLKANQVNPRKRTRAEYQKEVTMQKVQPKPYWMQETLMAQQSPPLAPSGPATFGVNVENDAKGFGNEIMTRGVQVESRPEFEGETSVRPGSERIPRVIAGASSPRGGTGKGMTGGIQLSSVPEFDPEGRIQHVGTTKEVHPGVIFKKICQEPLRMQLRKEKKRFWQRIRA